MEFGVGTTPNTPTLGPASRHSRSTFRRATSSWVASAPHPPVPEARHGIPRRVGRSPQRRPQNRPSRIQRASPPRSRGRWAGASSIFALNVIGASIRSSSRPVRSPERRANSKSRRTAVMTSPQRTAARAQRLAMTRAMRPAITAGPFANHRAAHRMATAMPASAIAMNSHGGYRGTAPAAGSAPCVSASISSPPRSCGADRRDYRCASALQCPALGQRRLGGDGGRPPREGV